MYQDLCKALTLQVFLYLILSTILYGNIFLPPLDKGGNQDLRKISYGSQVRYPVDVQ